MKKLLAPLFALSLAGIVAGSFVVAFHAGAAHADSGSAVTPAPTVAPGPSDKLHDPVSSPKETIDDLKMAKKTGWGVLTLAFAVILFRLLSRLGGWFTFLKKGKVSLVVASGTVFAATAYNAIMLGGTWVASIATAVTAMFAMIDFAMKHPDEKTT